MSIKARLKAAILPLCGAAFVALAWGLSLLLPAQLRLTRWERAAQELTLSAPTAEVCAVANLHFGVRLTAADVAVWRTLCQQGQPSSEALRIVVSYRRAGS